MKIIKLNKKSHDSYILRRGIGISSSVTFFRKIKMNILNEIKLHRNYITHYNNAKVRNIKFELSFKRFKQLLKIKYCYYSGKEFNDNNIRTFERLDPNKGYTDENTVVCNKRLNSRKSDLTINEIKMFYEGLKRKNLI